MCAYFLFQFFKICFFTINFPCVPFLSKRTVTFGLVVTHGMVKAQVGMELLLFKLLELPASPFPGEADPAWFSSDDGIWTDVTFSLLKGTLMVVRLWRNVGEFFSVCP